MRRAGKSIELTAKEFALLEFFVLHKGQVGAGNWDSLALGGTGGSNYSNNLANGYPSLQTVGDPLTTEPGNKIGEEMFGLSWESSMRTRFARHK